MLDGERVAVVVPAHDEEALLPQTLAGIPGFVDRIYVVDDASTDATAERARAAADPRIEVLTHERNQGVGAAIVHTAPYFGPTIIAVGSLVAGFLQFGSWSHALAVAGATIAVATLIGSIFATWLAGRQSQMNTTATFIGLLFFGWIWGLWGILLGIPLLAIVKTICDRKEEWRPVAELLSR